MADRKIAYSPSMMCADFLDLKKELDTLMDQKIEMLHIDIMDGQYVPNFTLGPDIARMMHNYSGIALDYHLIIEEIDRSLNIFSSIPGSTITFHPETSRHPVRTIQAIRDTGCKPSIAIDPAQTIQSMKHLLPLVDMVCVMTVNPGYSGQKLLPFCIDKIAELNDWKSEFHTDLLIEVDGNVSWENIPKMIDAGADILVLGTSSVFNNSLSRVKAYEKLNRMVQS
ncbi:MAG: ribulose-phosphate 3-epimerase [Cyclobacteriaceae bacterium]|nr:ribulose-phosphate 3-epimerase [Cyclobacteriaceae bacterium SS2]